MKSPGMGRQNWVVLVAALAFAVSIASQAEEPTAGSPHMLPVVRVCVDAKGALVGEPTVAKSSGNPILDVAALRLAKGGRYAPGKGQKGTNCFNFQEKFELKEE